MIYTVKKDEKVLEIDDNVFFDKQPKGFRDLFNDLKSGGLAEFDNCLVLVLDNGRVVITEKLEDDGKI